MVRSHDLKRGNKIIQRAEEKEKEIKDKEKLGRKEGRKALFIAEKYIRL